MVFSFILSLPPSALPPLSLMRIEAQKLECLTSDLGTALKVKIDMSGCLANWDTLFIPLLGHTCHPTSTPFWLGYCSDGTEATMSRIFWNTIHT